MCIGIAYQLTSLDPLTNATQCMLDAASMADLGANSIRVYHVDSAGDHDACMSAFASKGIYLWLDLDTFDTQFDQASQGRYGGLEESPDFVICAGTTSLEPNSTLGISRSLR